MYNAILANQAISQSKFTRYLTGTVHAVSAAGSQLLHHLLAHLLLTDRGVRLADRFQTLVVNIGRHHHRELPLFTPLYTYHNIFT